MAKKKRLFPFKWVTEFKVIERLCNPGGYEDQLIIRKELQEN